MNNPITFGQAGTALLAAVSGAAAYNAASVMLAFEISLTLALLVFCYAWLAAFVVGLLPYIIAIRLANRLRTRSWAFFTGYCVAIGLGLYSLTTPKTIGGLWLLLHFAASGAAAGTACWYELRRQARLDTSVRMS